MDANSIDSASLGCFAVREKQAGAQGFQRALGIGGGLFKRPWWGPEVHFIHSFDKHLSNAYYVLSTVSGGGGTAVRKIGKVTCLCRTCSDGRQICKLRCNLSSSDKSYGETSSGDNMGLGSEELGWPQSPGPFKATEGCRTTRHKGISSGGLKVGKMVSLWVLVGWRDGRWGPCQKPAESWGFFSLLGVVVGNLVGEERSRPEAESPLTLFLLIMESKGQKEEWFYPAHVLETGLGELGALGFSQLVFLLHYSPQYKKIILWKISLPTKGKGSYTHQFVKCYWIQEASADTLPFI